MVVVIHFSTNKDPDVYFGMNEKDETKILKALNRDWTVTRSDDSEWHGQNISEYPIHHWNAKKKG